MMMLQTYLAAFVLICLTFIGFGVGVLFFGKAANREACGTVPKAKNADCPSQKLGLCPGEDTSGLVKMAKLSAISHHNTES